MHPVTNGVIPIMLFYLPAPCAVNHLAYRTVSDADAEMRFPGEFLHQFLQNTPSYFRLTFIVSFGIIMQNKDVCAPPVYKRLFCISARKRVASMVNLERLLASTADINGQLARYGVKFGIYKNKI